MHQSRRWVENGSDAVLRADSCEAEPRVWGKGSLGHLVRATVKGTGDCHVYPLSRLPFADGKPWGRTPCRADGGPGTRAQASGSESVFLQHMVQTEEGKRPEPAGASSPLPTTPR